MDFDFSDDQRQLQDAVGRMLGLVSTSKEVRGVLAGQTPYSDKTWKQLLEMGAAAAAIPEAFGGAGLGYLELCLVAQEAGRYLAAAPLLSSFYLGAEAIRLAGSAAQQQALLPRIASGDIIATAWLGDAQGMQRTTHAPSLREDGRLTGQVLAVPDGGIADIAVLRAGGDLLLVDLHAAGVTRLPHDGIDPTRPLAELRFEGVPAQKLAGNLSGSEAAQRVAQGAAVLLAFEQLGGAEKVLETIREYALQRRAFGRPIGSFQAVKHKLADIYTGIELAKAHAYYGAWALAAGPAQLPRAAAAARVAATKAYNLAAEEGLHLHGGIGFTWEMDCHLHLRRARYLAQILGSEHFWRARLADTLLPETARIAS